MFFKAGKQKALENAAVCTWILILFHGAVMAGILLFGDVKYEVSDDFVMELLASGAFNGTPDAHLMFCSYIWGQLLSVFYRICAGVSWYFIAQMGVCFFSFCAVSYYLAHTQRFSMCVLFTVLLTVFFAGDLYLLPQFTKTAAAAIASGGCLFVWSLFHKRGKGCTMGGAALVIAGCLIRHNAVYVAGAYLFLYIFFETACLFQKNPKEFRRKIIGIYAAGGFLLLIIFALRWCNNMAYENEEDYRYYMDYSYARALIVDYPLPDYSACEKELQEIGLSENDYSLLTSWSFGDQSVFSLERMEQVRKIVDQCRPKPCPSFMDVIRRFYGRGILNYPGTWCCVILSGIGIWLSLRSLAVSVPAGIVTVSLMLYFISIGHSVYRVEFGYLFAAALLMIYTFPKKKREKVEKMAYILALFISLSQIQGYLPDQSYLDLTDEEYREYIDSTFNWSWDYLPEKYTKIVNQRDIRPNFWKEIEEHPENLYFLDFNTTIQSLYYEFSPWESLPKGSLRNMVYLGGVTVNHPVIKETLEKWNVENELPALLKENIYFVSNTTSEQVLKYLQEHYDGDASMTLYKTVDGYHIWSYEA